MIYEVISQWLLTEPPVPLSSARGGGWGTIKVPISNPEVSFSGQQLLFLGIFQRSLVYTIKDLYCFYPIGNSKNFRSSVSGDEN